jgi:phosphoserine phosphatase
MKKNVVFDFDHTLTTFDTIYPFLKFCNKDNFIVKKIKSLLWFVLIILYRFRIISNYNLKQMGIKLFLQGYSRDYIEAMSIKFNEQISYYDSVLEIFNSHIETKDNVFISSASYHEYLTVFSRKYENIKLSCSLIGYEDDKVTGLKFNNYEENKLLYFQDNNFEIDIFYTDSYSDRFLAKKAKKIVIVTKKGDFVVCNTYKEFYNYFKVKNK